MCNTSKNIKYFSVTHYTYRLCGLCLQIMLFFLSDTQLERLFKVGLFEVMWWQIFQYSEDLLKVVHHPKLLTVVGVSEASFVLKQLWGFCLGFFSVRKLFSILCFCSLSSQSFRLGCFVLDCVLGFWCGLYSEQGRSGEVLRDSPRPISFQDTRSLTGWIQEIQTSLPRWRWVQTPSSSPPPVLFPSPHISSAFQPGPSRAGARPRRL